MMMRVLICVMVLSGLAGAQDGWTAKWIAAPWSTIRDGAELDGSRPMPIFRHAFEVKERVQHAELRIAGLGQFEARIGDTKGAQTVGLAGLHQAWTDYRKTVTYETYDVTKLVAPGPHVISVMLGNGMYNVQRTKGRYTKFEGSFGPPKLIAQLVLTYTGGRTEMISTDETWRCVRGPVTFSSTYGGEDFDARKEPVGAWYAAGYDDKGWDAARAVDGPGGSLTPAIAPEAVFAEAYYPGKPTDVGGGRVVYDLGQNFAGVPEVEVTGTPGAVVRLTPGELLKADGSVSQASSGGPMWWTYTLLGAKAGETWGPKFGYYGFRYLQLEWISGTGRVINLRGIAWHSASKQTGTFSSSNETLNAIHKLIVEAMHNNEVSLFTDCPHREKLGWLEETQLVASGLMFNNDLRGLYAATDRNISDAQHDDGDVPTIAPQYTKFGPRYPVYDDSPEWGSAAVLAPWAAYRFYGDKSQLERDYPVMQRYIAFLQTKAVDGIVAYGLGDWYDIGPGGPGFSKLTTLGVTGTLIFYEDAIAMQKIAALLGKTSDASNYSTLAETEKKAFNAKFWDPANGFYDKGSQTAQAMPLALGIVPDDAKAKLLDYLVADIHAHQDHITTGEVGFPYLLRALMESGRNDVLLAIMLRKDPPSYGSQLEAGATSLTEAWDANPKSSQDHFMLGGAEEWFYRGLGGIDFDMSRSNGAARITIHPRMVAGVEWVKCGYDSVLGHIESEWRRGKTGTRLIVTVPAGAKATVNVSGALEVVESGVHSFIVK